MNETEISSSREISSARNNPLQGKRIAVVGAGISGTAAAKLARQKGASVSILEKNKNILDTEKAKMFRDNQIRVRLGEHRARDFQDKDMVILSPGIPEAGIKKLLPLHKNISLYSELEMAYWFSNSPIIGITGTNGKTTTVRLVSHILRKFDYKVFLGGNIGVPLSEHVLSGSDAHVLVLEISSFQLEHIRDFRANIGALLNISPNHLDYHPDMQEYFQSKMKLFQNQVPGDQAIFPVWMQKEIHEQDWIRAEIKYFDNTLKWNCPGLLGPHNQGNIDAAALVCANWQITKQKVESAIQDFEPDSHRLERVAEKKGVLFVNDSKATTLEALRAALNSLQGPVLLLAGGIFKGGNPAELRTLIREKVRRIGLFGDSKEIFQEAWKDCSPIFWEPKLEPALEKLIEFANPGDIVLLSPATSSFDLYNSYKERGIAFQNAVHNLEMN